MWNAYVNLVSKFPLIAAFVQFAILGMVGEWVSAKIRGAKLGLTPPQVVSKMISWGVLGFFIKIAFVGFDGFTMRVFYLFKGTMTEANIHLLQKASFGFALFFAFVKSVCTNLFFGPQMMLFHRWEDNLLLHRKGYQGCDFAIKTLLWFWIPAHTITFSIPNHDVQVGLAAVWSVVLGLILGLALGRRQAAASVVSPAGVRAKVKV
jgi:hypothetical protein